jgi:hypothetical protein
MDQRGFGPFFHNLIFDIGWAGFIMTGLAFWPGFAQTGLAGTDMPQCGHLFGEKGGGGKGRGARVASLRMLCLMFVFRKSVLLRVY